MKNIFRLLAALFMLFAVSQASAETFSIAGYTQTLFNSDSEMGSNEANDVLQTRDGYIYGSPATAGLSGTTERASLYTTERHQKNLEHQARHASMRIWKEDCG